MYVADFSKAIHLYIIVLIKIFKYALIEQSHNRSSYRMFGTCVDNSSICECTYAFITVIALSLVLSFSSAALDIHSKSLVCKSDPEIEDTPMLLC